jgi:hypothetical protein
MIGPKDGARPTFDRKPKRDIQTVHAALRGRRRSMEKRDPQNRDWAIDAEEDLAPTIPRAFFPWWISLPSCAWLGFGAHAVSPPALPVQAAVATAAAAFFWGVVLRRGPKPTLLHSWLATVAGIAAFLVGLLVYLNDDGLLRMFWASTSGAFVTYLVVMSLRRDAPAGLRRRPG